MSAIAVKTRFQQATRSNYLRELERLIDSYQAFDVSALEASPSNSPDRSALVRDGIFPRSAEDDVARLRVVVSAS